MADPIRPEDIYRFRWVDHVRLSPDGERVAYEVIWADAESRNSRSRVVVRRLLDPEPVEASAGPRRDHGPEWSPDGRRLAFVSKRGASDQVFVVDLAGGEPTQLSSLAEGAGNPLWSRDGTRIAYVGTVVSEPEAVVDDPRQPERSDDVRRTPVARVVTNFSYKHDGPGFTDGRHQHLFVVGAGDGGSATQLTNGPWDVSGFDWSPDGTRLAVVGNADANADMQLETHLYSVDFAGGLEKLATGFELNSATWSPRGDLIAYVGSASVEAGVLDRLFVVPASGGEARCLTANFDQAVTDSIVTDMRAGHGTRISWSSDGDRIFFPASGPGVTGLYSVDLDGNVRAEVGGERRIYDFDAAAGVIAFCASDTNGPGELHVVMRGAEARLTDLNPWLRDRHIAQPEEMSFTAPDGWVLQGWLLKPANFDRNRAYPLVLQVHGGPHAEYGWAFFHEFQMLVGMGFLVLYVNPRGSDGYGEVFRKAVVRDWGGKDFIDLMTALDQVIERTGFVDKSRLGIGGGSYGGFMTNWAIGQTDRFAAAVAMRSIANLVSEYAQHDIVLWGQLELGPPPWPNQDELWQKSPIRYVNNIKTPLLLTCGEMDLRCAISQSEEMFGALHLLGKTVEMVRFPDETHDLSRNGRPDRRVERLARIAGWFEKYLGTHTSDRVAVQEPMPALAAEPVGAAEPEPEAEPEPQPVEAMVAEPIVEAPPEPEPVHAVEPEGEEVEAEPLASAVEEVAPEPSEAAEVALLEQQNLEAPVPETGALVAEPAMDETVAMPVDSQPSAPDVAETVPSAPALQVAETVPPEPQVEAAPHEEEATQTLRVEQPQQPRPEPGPAVSEPAAASAVPTWAEAVPPPAAAPTWEEAAPAAPEGVPTWSDPAASALAPGAAPTWDQVPAAQPQPEPPPPQAPTAPPTPPATIPPVPVPSQLRSTVIAWPSAPGAGTDNGAPGEEPEVTEATSIMPAWQSPQASATKETLALHAVAPDHATLQAPAKLTFETGPFASRMVGIPNQSATVGRAPDNDIVIGDPATSGHHCRIELRGGAYWVSDLGSTNGTLVNGEPIIDKQLDDGDVLSIGQNTIRFAVNQQ